MDFKQQQRIWHIERHLKIICAVVTILFLLSRILFC